jgi:hypothetical protein
MHRLILATQSCDPPVFINSAIVCHHYGILLPYIGVIVDLHTINSRFLCQVDIDVID